MGNARSLLLGFCPSRGGCREQGSLRLRQEPGANPLRHLVIDQHCHMRVQSCNQQQSMHPSAWHLTRDGMVSNMQWAHSYGTSKKAAGRLKDK